MKVKREKGGFLMTVIWIRFSIMTWWLQVNLMLLYHDRTFVSTHRTSFILLEHGLKWVFIPAVNKNGFIFKFKN